MRRRKVYLIFTDTGTLFTRLIKVYTKHPLNHVSISFDDNLNEIFSFGRKKPYNPFIGGFVREKIGEGLFINATCKVYSYTVSEADYKKMQMKVRQIEAMKDLFKYNLLGLFAIILKYKLTRKNAFFCSQFVATILNEGQDVLEKTPCQCKPQDIMNIQGLQLEYQGKIGTWGQVPRPTIFLQKSQEI